MLLLLDARLRVVLDGELARVRLDDVLVAVGGLGALAQPHLRATGRVHRGQRHLNPFVTTALWPTTSPDFAPGGRPLTPTSYLRIFVRPAFRFLWNLPPPGRKIRVWVTIHGLRGDCSGAPFRETGWSAVVDAGGTPRGPASPRGGERAAVALVRHAWRRVDVKARLGEPWMWFVVEWFLL